MLKSVLIAGQAHGVLAMAAAYVLGSRVVSAGAIGASDANTRRAMLAGFFAAALVGFVNPMPAVFVNWGRYTQQAGQVLLPAAIVCWMRLIDDAQHGSLRTHWRAIMLSALVTAGLMLTHYIVTAFAALAVIAYALFGLVR